MTTTCPTMARRTGIVLVAGALLALANLWLSGPSRAQEDQDPALVQQGNELYGNHCSQCHGGNGLGNGQPGESDYGPPLINVGAASVNFMVASGRMPSDNSNSPLQRREAQFDSTQRAALVAYITQLDVPANLSPEEREELEIPERPGAPIPKLGDLDNADQATGRALFTSNCAACHGPTAQGIAVGQKDVSSNLADVPPLQVAEAIRTGPGVMPVFGPDNLDQQQLEAVVAWVQYLPERDSPGGITVGRSGPVSEGLLGWVIGMGLLGVAVYLLGERIGTTEPQVVADDPGDGADITSDDDRADGRDQATTTTREHDHG